jgi:pimeloyl-ACP methyl ester carboxylesterase
MATIVLVAGPPFGPPVWDAVRRRLEHHGHTLHVHALVGEGSGAGGVVAARARLADVLEGLPEAPVVVGHGLAVPVLTGLPPELPLAALVLSNGPVTRLDPVTRLLARVCARPGLAAATVLQPALFQRWLWSSAGLRRAVVNPYVMGRDTVVAVTAQALSTAAARRNLAAFIVSLDELQWGPAPDLATDLPTLLVWGDDDRLVPPDQAEALRVRFENCVQVSIPGGRHLHLVERPWELADRVHDWLHSAAELSRSA